MSHAVATRPANFQRTVRLRVPTPAPRMEPVATYVVERGMPKWLDVRMTTDDVIWAVKPWVGLNFVNPWPIVRMMRQPPIMVPAAMARPQISTTHLGVAAVLSERSVGDERQGDHSMVFWASFVPCAIESNDGRTNLVRCACRPTSSRRQTSS